MNEPIDAETAQAQLISLVERAYDETPPDPYDLWPHFSSSPRALGYALCKTPGADFVADFWADIETPDWEPEFADLLESYLYKKDEQEGTNEAENRLGELRAGAKLTPEEWKAYDEKYWEWQVHVDSPIGYVDRIPQPAGGRPVFFITEHREYGQMGDMVNAVGPFRTLDEVVSALVDDERSTLDAYLFPLEFDSSYKQSGELERMYREAVKRLPIEKERPADNSGD